MISESRQLTEARRRLFSVEQHLLSGDAELHLEEGLLLLEEISRGKTREKTIATNLGTTYAAKLKAAIERALSPKDVPQPALRHLMRLSEVLGASRFVSGLDVDSLTAIIGRRFIDSAFEGYSAEEKQLAIDRLLARM